MKSVVIALICLVVVLGTIAACEAACDVRQERAQVKDQCIQMGYADAIRWRGISFCVGYDLHGAVRFLKAEELE